MYLSGRFAITSSGRVPKLFTACIKCKGGKKRELSLLIKQNKKGDSMQCYLRYNALLPKCTHIMKQVDAEINAYKLKLLYLSQTRGISSL